jgi:hypothetical protein
LSINDVARLAVVQATAVWDYEADLGLTKPADIEAMQTVLEDAGVEFIKDGVKLRKGR